MLNNITKIDTGKNNFSVSLKAIPDRHKHFWESFDSDWEPELKVALINFVDSDTIVLDLGAWIGPITLYTAALGAKHVYSLEPDTIAYSYLEENYNLNEGFKQSITLLNTAISKENGVIHIGPLSGRSLGESTTSIEGTNLTAVNSIDFSTLFEKYSILSAKKLCIKIDIEGSEKYILDDLIVQLKNVNIPILLIIGLHPYHYKNNDSKNVEICINELIKYFSSYNYIQRRDMGEIIKYPDQDTEWRSELYHPNGLFDIYFLKEK